MIEQLDIKNGGVEDLLNCIKKINELVDAVNAIQKEREAERFEIQEWIGVLEAVRKSVNVHEKQIDELQMRDEELAGRINYTLAKATGDKEALKLLDEKYKPVDKFAEQRKWVGKLCRFWNFKDGAVDIGILKAVDNLKPTIPYINDIDCSYAFCEPVKPDDDIIYKGE